MAISKLIIVYNANGGIFNTIADTVHKLLSPKSYYCNLCAITYPKFKMHRKWLQYLKELNFPVEFLHADQFKQGKHIITPLPVILAQRESSYDVLISTDEINQCKDVDALILLLKKKLL